MVKAFLYVGVFLLFSAVVQPNRLIDLEQRRVKLKKMLGHLVHKLLRPHLKNKHQHKKHDILTMAAPPSIGSMLPATTSMTLMPNGVPSSAGSYIHHLMHYHPLNIPTYHWQAPHVGRRPSGILPVHLPEHYGPLGPLGHHSYYGHGPWRHLARHGLGYGVGYHSGHKHAYGPRYGWPRRRLGYGLGYHYGHGFPAGFARGYGHRLGYGYGHGYGHAGGNWLRPLRGWYPYSFDHSVDLRGDNGPDTMFLERSAVPAVPKVPSVKRKIALRRKPKSRKSSVRPKPVRHRSHAIRILSRSRIKHRLIPFGYRIERYKIGLVPLKKKRKSGSVMQLA